MSIFTQSLESFVALIDPHSGEKWCSRTVVRNVQKFCTVCLYLFAIPMLVSCSSASRGDAATGVEQGEMLVMQFWPTSLSRLSVATVSLAVAVIIIVLMIFASRRRSTVREPTSQRFAYFMLICVFITGFYGAITALLATSWLQANDISDSQEENIVAELASTVPPAPTTQIDRIIENSIDDPPPFEELRSLIRARKNVDDRSVLNDWQSTEEAGFYEFLEAVKTFKTQYLEVLEANNRLVTETAPLVLLNPAYDAKQRRVYRLGVGSYQKKMTRAIDVATQIITTDARSINTESRAAVRRMIDQLKRPEMEVEIQAIVRNSGFFGQQSGTAQSFERKAYDAMPGLTTTILMPKEPALLGNWGDLGYVVGWVIRPSSIDVLYIVGMVGFGILGSSLTTFVSASARKLGNPNVKDVIAVVIKGTTAAIVVYLFIFGGFEVFSNADVFPFTPNVYMLFLTCFLGAVFSDRIWRYAELRLIKQLRSSRNSTQPPPRPD